jgi:hypothetical protein
LCHDVNGLIVNDSDKSSRELLLRRIFSKNIL